jgi:streptomycin 6-kinase
VVLKILLANTHEPEALRLFNGNGCVRLLDYDSEAKCLLLEYVKPGISLKTLFPDDDHTAIEITAQLIKKIHAKNLLTKAIGFNAIEQWLGLLHNFKSKKISSDLSKKAQQLSEKLLDLKQELYLLHGDLHHENILKSDNTWIAIDPKGVVGPLEYEVGRFIMNPIPHLLQQSNAKEIIKNRIDKFSKFFDFDKQRLVDWVFVQAVLSACWTEQNGSEDFFNYFIKFAETIENL